MILSIPLTKTTDNPWQTRQGLDPAYIAELAADIQRNGLLQSPVGRVIFQTAVEKAILDAADIQKYAEIIPTDRAFTVQLAIGHNRAAADRLLSNKWYFDELLIPLGITIEWPVDVEAALDEVRHRWQRIQSWMPDEPGQTRPLPQINGNLLNIGRLLDEIAALPASDETYDLLRQLEAARYRLEKLSQQEETAV
ncbi:MAG: hypothetical protein KF770_17545 [Anaerolineae bacterium]|nr:hypothetical protein [Anaerolineae bacterium]